MAFVDVASRDYGLRGRPTNVSRVSAMTGIGRKEVRRLRGLKGDYPENPRVELSPLSDVLHHWFTDSAYLDSRGEPRVLPLQQGRVSFANLVKQCAGDVPLGAIKVELIRSGAVTEDSAGRLRARRRHVVPEGLDEKLITSMVFGLRSLACTIAFNSRVPNLGEAGHIERFVESECLSDAGIERVRPLIRERVTAFTESVDDMFSNVEAGELRSGRRIGVGVYYYEDD
jgi:hypothetical protein